MTIKEAQELVEAVDSKKEINHNELTNMALLTEDIGRLSRIMANRYGDHSRSNSSKKEIADGIGDVLWSLIRLSNRTGNDLTVILSQTLEKNCRKK